MRVRYTRRSARQLDLILAYLAARSPQGADHVFDRIEAVLAMLRDQPLVGRAVDRPGFRRIVVNPYPHVIFYQPTESEIIVHSARHAAREPRLPER